MKTKHSVNSTEDVRRQFNRVGKPIAEWARENGFTQSLVYELLRGRLKGKRGESHRAAVLLGMKEGEIQRRAA